MHINAPSDRFIDLYHFHNTYTSSVLDTAGPVLYTHVTCWACHNTGLRQTNTHTVLTTVSHQPSHFHNNSNTFHESFLRVQTTHGPQMIIIQILVSISLSRVLRAQEASLCNAWHAPNESINGVKCKVNLNVCTLGVLLVMRYVSIPEVVCMLVSLPEVCT